MPEKNKPMTIMIKPSTHNALKVFAAQNKMTMGEAIRFLLAAVREEK